MDPVANEVESAALEMAVNSRKTVDSVLMAHGYTAEQCQAIVDDALQNVVVCGRDMFPQLRSAEAIAERERILDAANKRLGGTRSCS